MNRVGRARPALASLPWPHGLVGGLLPAPPAPRPGATLLGRFATVRVLGRPTEDCSAGAVIARWAEFGCRAWSCCVELVLLIQCLFEIENKV